MRSEREPLTRVKRLGMWRWFCGCEGELCRPPCENGGRCLANEKGDWRCYCWPDFSGERCEVNHCTDYCLNGGTCTGSPLGESTSDTATNYPFLYVLLLVLCYKNKANKPIAMQHFSQNSLVRAAGVHAHNAYFTILGFIKVQWLREWFFENCSREKQSKTNYVFPYTQKKKKKNLGCMNLSLLAFEKNAG